MPHTPGPWQKTRQVVLAPDPNRADLVVTVANCHNEELAQDDSEANACLIAAAPELLACLELLEAELRRAHQELRQLPGGDLPREALRGGALDDARKAIRKAKGA